MTSFLILINNLLNLTKSFLAVRNFTGLLQMTNNDYTITIGDSTFSASEATLGANTITIDTSYTTDTGSEFTYNVPDTFVLQDFVHSMPELSRVKLMCEQYPALNKVYEQFKLIYKMVDQDYKGNIESKEALF